MPETRHQDMVERAATPVHTHADTRPLSPSRKVPARKLGALITIQDVGGRNHQRSLQRLQTS
jgi:hypothetical protein